MENVKRFGKARKITIAVFIAVLSAVLCIGTAFVAKEIKFDKVQEKALEELDLLAGEYNETRIVLTDTSEMRAKTLAEGLGAKLRITKDGKFATLTLPDGVNIRDVYEDERNRKDLEDFSPDYYAHIADEAQDETEIPDEPSMRIPTPPDYQVTDTEFSEQSYLNYLHIGNTWSQYRGQGVTVAVIDTGIDYTHPEFAGKISEFSYNASKDKIVKDYDAATHDIIAEGGTNYDWSLINDEQGHGTAVAGVIAAQMNNAGIVGIAPEVSLIVIKAECDANGSFTNTSDLVFGLYYAIERNAAVVNMSFGGYGRNFYVDAAKLAVDSDIVCVAAAGNDGTTMLSYPAADKNVIGVGALRQDSWELADYSNYGDNSDIVAPGSVYTTQAGGGYKTADGTSFSSPVVAASLALLKQKMQYAEFTEVRELLYASVYDIGDLGEDWYYGYGVLDINALLMEERGTVTFDYLTDEIDDTEQKFIRNHTLLQLPEPTRNYHVFDGWYYDIECTERLDYYTDVFTQDLTLYANWVNEDDGVPYTYVTLPDDTIEIRSYTGHRRYITIPEKIEGKTVTSVGDCAFSNERRLRQVNLPVGLTSVKRSAFENCAGLLNMKIPDGVTAIGDFAFKNTPRMSSVSFGETSALQTVGKFAFSSSGLKRFDLPETLTDIDGSAFYCDMNLQLITVHEGNENFRSQGGVLFNGAMSNLVAYPVNKGAEYTLPDMTRIIGDYAFAFARLKTIDLAEVEQIGTNAFVYSALEGVTIPDSVTIMKGSAFANSKNLKTATIGAGLTAVSDSVFFKTGLETIVIPGTIQSIGEGAFADCPLASISFVSGSQCTEIGKKAFAYCDLISEIDIPESVIAIGTSAFSDNYSLGTVTFGTGSNLKVIGSNAFKNCVNLRQIVLPENLRGIGSFAFKDSGLTTVSLPAGVEELGAGAFASCHSLTDISADPDNAVYSAAEGVLYNKDKSIIEAYPAGNARTDYTIENTVTKIGDYAFCGAYNLTGITFPVRLETIGEYAFYDCEGISNYTLPESLAYIERYAFAENSSLGKNGTTLHIPDNVCQISNFAFCNDNNMRYVSFGADSRLPRISYAAFAYTGLYSIRIPGNVSTVAQNAFVGSKNLTSVTFAANSKITSIPAYMFKGSEQLTGITFENGSKLTNIQAHGFDGLPQLRNISFGDAALTGIGNFAFRNCKSLASMNIPEGVTRIGRFAFFGDMALTRLDMPTTIDFIGRNAFNLANSLDIYFKSETLPLNLQENWDNGIKGYYVGVTDVVTEGDWSYAVLTDGDIAITKYSGEATDLDLTNLTFGGQPAGIKQIGGYAFYRSDVESIVLPATLENIQRSAFAQSRLTAIVIPGNTKFIGQYAFYNTPLASISFADDREGNKQLEKIEQYAFSRTGLSSIVIPSSLKMMERGVFAESDLERLEFEQNSNLTLIPQLAFARTKIADVVIPDSVGKIDHNAFFGCADLLHVDFGTTDKQLMSNAFYNTGIAGTLEIPANVTYIGEYALVGLENLTAFDVDASNPNYSCIDGLLYNKDGSKLIAVPAGRTGEIILPESLETIGFGAFENSHAGRVVFNPDSNILTLGYRAFYGAKNIVSIDIPASVVSIDYYAFAMCENLTTVNFAPDNMLTGIYEGAFYGCRNLRNITLPDMVVEISDFAFYGCASLESIPVSVTNKLKRICDFSFAYTGINELNLPDTLYDIGDYAFKAIKIKTLTVPEANKKELVVGLGAFADCNDLTEITLPFIGAGFEDDEITWFGYIFGAGIYQTNDTYIPKSLKTATFTEGITEIYSHAFRQISNKDLILNIPHSVRKVYSYSFYNCLARYEFTNSISIDSNYLDSSYFYRGGLSGEIRLEKGVKYIGDSAFGWCSGLQSVRIPDSVTSIGWRAFSGCSGLQSVMIPDSVTSIGWYAFENCSGLTSVKIPDNSAGHIDRLAFSNCHNLKKIVMGGCLTDIDDEAFLSCGALHLIYITDLAAWCNGGCYAIPFGKNLYLNDTLITDLVIPDSVTRIGDGAFKGCSGIQSAVIPDSVARIGDFAFSGCSGLQSIAISDSVTSIGNYVFRGCSELASIVIPNSVTSIGQSVFSGCSGLQSIVIPDSVTSIGDYAFSGCKGLTSVVMPVGVTNICYGVFNACSGLKNITIPDSVTSIGQSVFSGCSGLQSIVIPDSVTSIGDRAFYNCNGLQSIVIPDSVTSIGVSAFGGCNFIDIEVGLDNPKYFVQDKILYRRDDRTKISIVYVPQNVTNVVIPDGVTNIKDGAFYNCRLSSITIPDSMISIGDSAFYNCKWLYKIINNSSLHFTIGDQNSYGRIAAHARVLVDADGIKQFKDDENFIFVDTPDGFRYSYYKGVYRLIAYLGSEETVTLPLKVEIDGQQFPYDIEWGAAGLKNIILPYGMSKIADWSFASDQYNELNSVIISDTVTGIGYGAFQRSSRLKSVVISDSVTSIDGCAFYDCSGLEEVHITDMAAWCNIKFSGHPSNPLSYAHNLYLNDELITDLVIPDGVTSIGDYAFSGCSGLQSIVIPDSVTSIGKDAFYGCSGLTSILIPDSVTSIGDDVFANTNIDNMAVDEGNTAFILEEGVLYDYAKTHMIWISDMITDIVVPASVTDISALCGRNQQNHLKTIRFEENSSLTSISDNLFQNFQELTIIEIPDGVTSIGKHAFRGCKGLTSVVIPNSVTSIGDSAFRGCKGLTSVVIPDSVTYIERYAFLGCSGLTSVVISDGVMRIDGEVFYGCSGLTSVVIPNSVTDIGWGAFYNCSGLTSVTIGSSVTSIGQEAFLGCDGLKEVHITDIAAWCNINFVSPSSNPLYHAHNLYLNDELVSDGLIIPNEITCINNCTFYGCSGLINVVIPDSVMSIGNWAFSGCSSLTNIEIPDSVTSIGDYAFSGCSGLTNMVIPDGVTSIGKEAFRDCSGLISVTIPQSVVSIVDNAFVGCECDYYYMGDVADWCSISFDKPQYNYSGYNDFSKLHINNCLLTDLIIPDGVTSIGCAFSKSKSLTSITIPDSVTEIDYKAFVGCENLKDIYYKGNITNWWNIIAGIPVQYNLYINNSLATNTIIPNGITHITNCFSNCISLTTIEIPDTVTSIDAKAFYGCSGLKSIEIPDTVTSIGDYAFYNCGGLQSVTIGNGVSGIGAYAFSGCSGLTSVIISDGVTSIGDAAFKDCSGLTSVTIGNGVTSIGNSAFSGCKRLTGVVIPDGVTSIGAYAFHDCHGLSSIVIPNGVTSIGASVFYGCNNISVEVGSDNPNYFVQDKILYNRNNVNNISIVYIPKDVKKVTIPYGVKSIGGFSGCYLLTSIVIPDSVTSINGYAFHDCHGLSSIVIPNGVTYIPDFAFQGCRGMTSITIPESVMNIGNNAFDACSCLYEINNNSQLHFTIGDGNRYGDIARYARVIINADGTKQFKDDENFTFVETPDGFRYSYYNNKYCMVAYLGDEETITLPSKLNINGQEYSYSMNHAVGFKNVIIPNTMTKIDDNAFRSLVNITIPDSVTSIGDYAFAFCGGFESIVIPDSVTSIGRSAFEYCSGLQSVVIPDSVTNIGYDAFYGCTRLKEVHITDIAAWCNIKFGGWSSNPLSYAHDLYLNGEPITDLVIPDEVTSISDHVFEGCGLTSIVITDNVTSIGYEAFRWCNGLVSIVIPDNVTSIGAWAFAYCRVLESIVIPDSVTSIGNRAFYNCNRLTSATIGSSVTSIGQEAFAFCGGLESIVIPDSVTNIGSDILLNTAYYDNPDNWEGDCLYIGKHLIKVKPDVKYFVIRPDTICVASEAFKDCLSLVDVEVPEGIWIGNHAFMNCSSLHDIVIPGCSHIGSGVFSNCTRLEYITMGKGVVSSLSGVNNLKILILNELPDQELYRYFGTIPFTLKTIVMKKRCRVFDQNLFANLDDIIICVEEDKQDVLWDHDFENWNNGNPVLYNGEWINAEFRNEKDELITSDYYSVSQVIRQPYVGDKTDGGRSNIFMGWDIDGDELPDTVPATSALDISAKAIFEGHRPGGWTVITEATCETDGLKRIVCLDCNKVLKEQIIPRFGHNKGDFVRKVSPTCTEKGYDVYVCTICGQEYHTNFVPASGHVFGEWITDAGAGCETDGQRHRVCTVCNETENEVIPAAGHSYTYEIITEATCCKQGEVRHVCTVCGKTITEILPATGEHNFEKVYVPKSFIQLWIEKILNVFFGYESDHGYYYLKCKDCGMIQANDNMWLSGIRIASAMQDCGDLQLIVNATETTPGIYGRYGSDGETLLDAHAFELTDRKQYIIGQNLTLGKDISVNYYVHSEIGVPVVRFTRNGKTVSENGTLTGENTYKFTYEGVNPQCMGDIIKAELYVDGVYIETIDNYSVLQYCTNMLTKTEVEGASEAKLAALKVLIKDLLDYGAKAQIFKDYKTDQLVNAGLSGHSEFETVENTDKSLSESSGTDMHFNGASLFLNNTVSVFYEFVAPEAESENITAMINDRAVEIKSLGNGIFRIYTDDIMATGFDRLYTAKIYLNNALVQTMTYSVRSYVYSVQNRTDSLGDLVKSMYVYGRSAVSYIEAE